MHKQARYAYWIGGVLMTVALGTCIAAERGSDRPGARRQAMDEWYNDTAAQRTKQHGDKREHRQSLWSLEYERFMLEAAQRERARHARWLPLRNQSEVVIDPTAATKSAVEAHWTNIGPTKSEYVKYPNTTQYVTDTGRVNAIVTAPADPDTIYVAFSGGGVWKSSDGGAFWQATTETMGSLSVGTIEMDPNNASVLYLGLGDAFDGTGIGLAKSTNGADTWTDPIVLGSATKIQDIQVAPGNSNVVLVGTNQGLYRSVDAGASYSKVAIATGQTVDPFVWTLAWGGGANFVLSLDANYHVGQVWRSSDSGATWTQSAGLTDADGVARISVAAAPSNRNVMYALATKANPCDTCSDTADIFKSTDNGATWSGIGKSDPTTFKTYVNPNQEYSNVGELLGGQGWYNHAIIVDPSNANIAYFGGALHLIKTSDGGDTFRQISNWQGRFGLPYVHADFHAAHFASNGLLYLGTDGGIARSSDGGTTWSAAINEGIASHLIYQIGSSTNNRSAVIAGMQDNGTRVRVGSTGVYNQELAADGFGCDINQTNANLMLGSYYNTAFYKSSDGGRTFAQACAGITHGNVRCGDSDYFPFRTLLSRWAGDASGNTLYTTSFTKVYKTSDYAGSWAALGTSGLPTTEFQIRGVGAAPNDGNVLGIVASAGRVYLTTDGGSNWAAASGALPNAGHSLSWIAFDPTDRSIVYVASVAPDSSKAHLWRSANFGATWARIDTGGFPTGIPVNAIVVDPVARTTLYAATHLGVYRSTDSGGTWARYGAGMPLVNVTDLYVAADGSLMRAGTFGRAVWELAPGTGGNVAPVANFTSTSSGLTATFTDASTDSDGSIAARSWSFGDGSTSTLTNPSHTYAAAGTYPVALMVTDNGGATHTKSSSVTVTDSSANVLTNGVAKTGISGALGSSQYWTLSVPANATNLKFVTSGGTGDADLYAKFGVAPTTTVNDCKSEGSTNTETCSIATAQAGTYHVLVKGYSAFSGMNLTGRYSLPRTVYSNTADYPINDNATIESPIAITGRSGDAYSDTAVQVTIVHTYQGDLKVDLIAPDGSAYVLHNRSGGSADNIDKTYTVNLSTESINGTWRLRVTDAANNDVGKIDRWSITL